MKTNPQFVFIIGAARSGTKFLRDILGESNCVNIVPFDVNYVWRYGSELLPHDAIASDAVNIRVRRYIEKRLISMANHNRAGTGRLIVEKTVSNTLRVPYLYALFPTAKFIHLIRDGRDVAESAARMWAAPPEYRYLFQKLRYFPLRNFQYASWYIKRYLISKLPGKKSVFVWGPRYPGIEADSETNSFLEIAARQWVVCVETALNGLTAVQPEQQTMVYYEDLVTNQAAWERILEFLNINDPQDVLKAYREHARRDTIGKWQGLDIRDKKRLLEIQNDTLKLVGYLSPEHINTCIP